MQCVVVSSRSGHLQRAGRTVYSTYKGQSARVKGTGSQVGSGGRPQQGEEPHVIPLPHLGGGRHGQGVLVRAGDVWTFRLMRRRRRRRRRRVSEGRQLSSENDCTRQLKNHLRNAKHLPEGRTVASLQGWHGHCLPRARPRRPRPSASASRCAPAPASRARMAGRVTASRACACPQRSRPRGPPGRRSRGRRCMRRRGRQADET
jgi:hypothetical protein